MSTPPKEMQSFSARLATFEQLHHLSKRRASSQSKKKGANTVEWPHPHPSPIRLAKAGFFYRPATDSLDNVQCFLCNVKLDGWEASDDPIKEHIAHSHGCAWATALSVWREEEEEADPETRDPLSDEMIAVRKATFAMGDGWPHESKKGWKCKITKMVDAGWCWDPAADGEDGDGVTCFYCNLSLDGWEPKDDPFVEHKRREPACRFFELLEHYHGPEAADGKAKKSKAKSKGVRSSTASKASRMSTQSAMSTMSDVPSMPGSYVDSLGEASLAGADDSILTTATNTSTTKGKKKGGRTKAAAKGTKGKKKTVLEEPVDEPDVQYPDMSTQDMVSQIHDMEEEAPAVPQKAVKRGTRASKQVVDSSVVEISHIDAAPPKKTRGRKPKAQKEPEPEPEEIPQTPDVDAIAQQRLSEVSAQIQDELEHSIDNFAPADESTPMAVSPKPQRGVKRTSDGARKQQQVDSSVVEIDVPIAPKAKPAAKGKRGRPKKASSLSTDAERDAPVNDEPQVTQEDPIELDTGVEAKPARAPAAKKGKGRPKGKKNSSARSSKATVTVEEPEPAADEPEDLARDEMEIEQELERIAAEQASQQAQAVQEEQEHVEEFEPSPSSGRVSKDSTELQQVRDEVQAEDENVAQGEDVSVQDFASPPRQSHAPAGMTPSPAGSDKENRPSSVFEPSAKQVQPAIILSPTKTTRIPLAASTPNRSPAKSILSPSKQISHLGSTAPWNAVDLDTVLVPSPQPSPGKLGQQLVAAAGTLTSPEKKMSVEEWVRFRADKGEEDLRRRCEQMVATFEKEGMRALDSLNGIHVVA